MKIAQFLTAALLVQLAELSQGGSVRSGDVNLASPRGNNERDLQGQGGVVLEVWTSPEYDWDPQTGVKDGPNIALFQALKEVVIGFDDDLIDFQPNVYINSGENVCSVDANGAPLDPVAKAQVCDANCCNGHRYCAAPPTDPVHARATGKMLVEESMRRLCVWRVFGAGGKWHNEETYFDYLLAFHENKCAEKNFQQSCIDGFLVQENIEGRVIANCMSAGGGLEMDRTNPVLEAQILLQQDKQIDALKSLPAVFVNGNPQADLSVEALFATICDNLPEEKKPQDICSGNLNVTLGEDEDPEEEKAAEEVLEEEIAQDLGAQPLPGNTQSVTEEEEPEVDVGEEEIEKEEEILEDVEAEDAGIQPESHVDEVSRPVIEVWTTPGLDWDPETQQGDGPNLALFDHLKMIKLGLGDNVVFRPQFYISKQKDVCIVDDTGRPLTIDGQTACADDHCTNQHRYCADPPDGLNASGKNLVVESLRRLCLWEVFGRNEDGADDVLFFDYLTKFHELQCDKQGYDDNCIAKAFIGASVDTGAVKACIEKSGGLTADVENSILQELQKVEKETFIHYHLKSGDLPIVIINDQPLDQETARSVDAMFNLVCSQYEDDKKPDVCQGDLEETLGEDEPPAVESPDLEETIKEAKEAEQAEQVTTETSTPTAAPSNAPSGAPSLPASKATESETEPEVPVAITATTEAPLAPLGITVDQAASGKGTWDLDSAETTSMSARETELPEGSVPSVILPPKDGDPNDGLYQLDLKIVDAAIDHLQVLKKCEVDTEVLVTKLLTLGTAGGNIKHEAEEIESDIPMLMTQNCPHEQGEEILLKMEEFHRCSMFDLQELIETFPSTAVGVLMRCAYAYSNMTKEEEETGFIPEACIRTIEAESVLGRGLFGLYLYPDVACPCFEKLHDSVPECTADVWPIPINGALVKVQSCLAGQYCQQIDGMCEQSLNTLNNCLPPKNTLASSIDCQATFEKCSAVYDHVPPMLNAAPLPDACIRVAEGSKFFGTHVVERYDAFRHQCGENIELWEGHTPVAEFKAFVQDGIMGINYRSLPFMSGAASGFVAGIVFTIVFIIVRNICRWFCACCRRCWARCCSCCRKKKMERPKTKDYATVDTSGDDVSEYHD